MRRYFVLRLVQIRNVNIKIYIRSVLHVFIIYIFNVVTSNSKLTIELAVRLIEMPQYTGWNQQLAWQLEHKIIFHPSPSTNLRGI